MIPPVYNGSPIFNNTKESKSRRSHIHSWEMINSKNRLFRCSICGSCTVIKGVKDGTEKYPRPTTT